MNTFHHYVGYVGFECFLPQARLCPYLKLGGINLGNCGLGPSSATELARASNRISGVTREKYPDQKIGMDVSGLRALMAAGQKIKSLDLSDNLLGPASAAEMSVLIRRKWQPKTKR